MRKLIFYLSMFGVVLASTWSFPACILRSGFLCRENHPNRRGVSSGRRLRHVFPDHGPAYQQIYTGQPDGGC